MYVCEKLWGDCKLSCGRLAVILVYGVPDSIPRISASTITTTRISNPCPRISGTPHAGISAPRISGTPHAGISAPSSPKQIPKMWEYLSFSYAHATQPFLFYTFLLLYLFPFNYPSPIIHSHILYSYIYS